MSMSGGAGIMGETAASIDIADVAELMVALRRSIAATVAASSPASFCNSEGGEGDHALVKILLPRDF